MTKYASGGLAFAAALTGIIGDTHDPAHPGIGGLTPLGCGAIIVATLSCIVILIETYRDQAKINWQAQQKTKVQRIANRQVIEAVGYLLNPFRVVIRDIWTKTRHLDVDLDQLDNSPTYVVGRLFDPAIRAELKNVDLRGKPNVFTPILWWEYFAKAASEARQLLNQAAAKYSGYLDPDALVAIEEVRGDELVYFRLPHLGELESANKHISPLPLSDAFGPRGDNASLDTMLERLQRVLDRTSAVDGAA